MPQHNAHPSASQALGQSEAFIALQERISRAAKTDRPIILIGERGTGKELAAARLHLLSQRWGQPYCTLNCGALTPSLIESELFGHEAGAFTGALRQRKGRFEAAQGGSMFLDEIGNLPLTVQEKILRVVEYGQMERVGSAATLRVDVRLIAATHENLPALAASGRFRYDLLDRLAFEVITLPPLRARREDIPMLAGHFARRMATELGRSEPPTFSETALRELLAYPWPGNVRELKNVVERMVYQTDHAEIEAIRFDPFASAFGEASAAASCRLPVWNISMPAPGEPDETVSTKPPADQRVPARGIAPDAPPAAAPHVGESQAENTLPLGDAVAALERRRLREALTACRFNQRRAAEALGLTYDQFRRLYRKYAGQLN